ncbi:hypothetical protein A6R68_18943 [Neotoma lepida]|uniref:Uncharacterized protein n=1 Tax=Neotoma lepida TaxID=56216 RepID=A0A1A6HKA0_NEOLE|nr:hypothetical protein A6R68_18943 [Neotoma lepida]
MEYVLALQRCGTQWHLNTEMTVDPEAWFSTKMNNSSLILGYTRTLKPGTSDAVKFRWTTASTGLGLGLELPAK